MSLIGELMVRFLIRLSFSVPSSNLGCTTCHAVCSYVVTVIYVVVYKYLPINIYIAFIEAPVFFHILTEREVGGYAEKGGGDGAKQFGVEVLRASYVLL